MNRHESRHHRKTNWYVITGGPCSGKSTVVDLLRQRGFQTSIEKARHYIDLQRGRGKSVEEIARHQREFQLHVLNMQIALEKTLKPDEITFLDRAIPDARAYYKYLGLPEDKKLESAIATVGYKKVFILDYLPLVSDYARREDQAAQKRIHRHIIEVYRTLPFPIVTVSVMPPEERVEFILANL